MKRALVAAGLGIAVLFGGGVVLVFLATGPLTSAASPAAQPSATAPPEPAALAFASPAPAPAGVGATRAGVAPLPEAPASSVPRVLRKTIRKALLAAPVQSRLARCVDGDVGFGGDAAPGRIPRARPAVLTLELETRRGEVRIAEAQVQSWGGASEPIVACARDVLRGKVVAAPVAQPGRRLRMPFTLNPRSEVLAGAR